MFCFVAVYGFVYHLHVILTVKESQHVYALAINHQPQYKMPHASWEREKGQRKARVGQTGRERETPIGIVALLFSWRNARHKSIHSIHIIHRYSLGDTHTHTHIARLCVCVFYDLPRANR